MKPDDLPGACKWLEDIVIEAELKYQTVVTRVIRDKVVSLVKRLKEVAPGA